MIFLPSIYHLPARKCYASPQRQRFWRALALQAGHLPFTIWAMLIGFDASRAFAAEATGTENYSLNLLRALAKVDRVNRYRVYLRGSQFRVHSSQKKTVNRELSTDNFKWPSNFEFVRVWPRRFWTQVGLAWETWKNPVDLLFVPAHTLPILCRRRFF